MIIKDGSPWKGIYVILLGVGQRSTVFPVRGYRDDQTIKFKYFDQAGRFFGRFDGYGVCIHQRIILCRAIGQSRFS